MTRERLDILGVPVWRMTAAQAVEALDEWTDHGPVNLAYLNAHSSNVAARNPEYLAALRAFQVFNDGIGVDIAAKVLHGRAFPENLTGTDFTGRYLRESRKAWRVYLLGARPGVAEAAAHALKAQAPHQQIAGVRDGYFAPEDSDAVAQAVRDSGANLLLVAMGNPAQELWMARHGAATGCQLTMGVGALFDFLSGRVSRAPEWLRAARSEWIYRLALEPRRLAARYLVGNPVFLARTLRRKIGR